MIIFSGTDTIGFNKQERYCMAKRGFLVGLVCVGLMLSQTGAKAEPQTADAKVGGTSEYAIYPCKFSIPEIIDKRSNAGEPFEIKDAGDLRDWVKSSFMSLPGYSQQPVALTMNVEIIKAYAQPTGSLMSGNIVLRVRYQYGGAILREKYFRGIDESMNWITADSEKAQAFSNAMLDVLGKIAADVDGVCRRGSHAPLP